VVGGAADGGEIYELKNPRSNGYDYTLYLYKTGPVRASVVRRTLRTKTEVWLYPSSTTNLSTMHNRAIHAVLSDIEEKGMSEFFSPAGK
jgi:hypothetical protein